MSDGLSIELDPVATGANALTSREHIRTETLERVVHFLSKPKLPVYPDLKGMCERVSDSYRDRVVIELLQNAHDAHPAARGDGRVKIILDPGDGDFGTLNVANDGYGFTKANFDALCSPTRTTKNVNDAIGNKGVGFLSAFQVCSHPQIYSRLYADSTGFDGFCFQFADDATVGRFLDEEGYGGESALVITKMPRLYLACPADASSSPVVARLADEGFATVVRLPLKNADAYQAVAKQIAQLAAEMPPVQLFLSRIGELTIENGATPVKPMVMTRDCEILRATENFRLLKAESGARSYVIAERRIPYEEIAAIIARDVTSEKLPEPWSDWTGDAFVSLAVATDGEPLSPRLYNFLPMGVDAAAPLAGYLDAPFFTSIDRLKLQPGVELNDRLMEAARELAIEGALAARDLLPEAAARHAVLDLLLWTGVGVKEVRENLIALEARLLPTIAMGKKPGWTSVAEAKIWNGDDFVTPQYAAKVGRLSIIDPIIGAARKASLTGFVSGTAFLKCTPVERIEVMEAVAGDLEKRSAPIARWDQFYRSLSVLFKDEGELLLVTCVLDFELCF